MALLAIIQFWYRLAKQPILKQQGGKRSMQFRTRLEQYTFEKYILEVSIATLERGGVTTNPHTYQFLAPIDAWGLPKYPGKTAILPPEANIAEELIRFIQVNNRQLQEPDVWLGTWINPYTKYCHLDMTTIYPTLEEAMREASLRSMQESRTIVAIYNFKQNQTVYL
jgi:hypothetical protein